MCVNTELLRSYKSFRHSHSDHFGIIPSFSPPTTLHSYDLPLLLSSPSPLSRPRQLSCAAGLLLGSDPALDLLEQLNQLLLFALDLEPAADPLLGLLEPAHLKQALAAAPPGLGVALPLGLDAGLGVDRRLGPVVQSHVRLRPVAVERAHLLAHELRGLPIRARERHLQTQGVELDGLGVPALLEHVVAVLARLVDLDRPLLVDRDGGRGHRHVVLETRVQRPVEGVECGEFGLKGPC